MIKYVNTKANGDSLVSDPELVIINRVIYRGKQHLVGMKITEMLNLVLLHMECSRMLQSVAEWHKMQNYGLKEVDRQAWDRFCKDHNCAEFYFHP